MERYEIIQKLFCITTDNASNNTEMTKYISQYLKNKYDIIWNPEQHHISCLNHVINLAVQDFLRSIKGLMSLEDSIEHLRDEEDEDKISPEGFAGTMWKIRTISKV